MTTTTKLKCSRELLDSIQHDTINLSHEDIETALNGDADKAATLCFRMNGSNRGYWAVKFGMERLMHPKAYRSFLENAWDHDHQHVQNTAFSYGVITDKYDPEYNEDSLDGCFTLMESNLKQCFEYAAFPIPADLPETLTIYRGCYRLNAIDTACGFSWTLSKKTGEWFAKRVPFRDVFAVAHIGSSDGPTLVKTTIKREDVAMFTNGREEQEIVTFAVDLQNIEEIEVSNDN